MTDRRFESIGNILNKPRPAHQTPETRPPTEPAAADEQPAPGANASHATDENRTAQTGTTTKPARNAKASQPRTNATSKDGQPATVFSLQGRRTPPDGQPQTTPTAPVTTAGQPASRTADGGARRIALRLDPDLHTALAAEATRQNSSHGNIVLTALERAHAADVLTDLASNPSNNDTGLFPRLQPRKNAQPTVLAEIRLHARAVATIDDLVDTHQLASRTELITKALRWHLETDDNSPQDNRRDDHANPDGHEATTD